MAADSTDTADITEEEEETEHMILERNCVIINAEPVVSSSSSIDPKEMRVVMLAGFGGIGKLRVTKRTMPEPQRGEVKVRVKACGLNFVDLMVRQGNIDNPPKPPLIPGFECSGIVESIGENTQGFEIGDRVMAFVYYNAWAEVVCTPVDLVYKMPDKMTFQEAAAFTLNYVAAYMMLFEVANLREGMSVLVHSAGGSVGQAVAQLCSTVPNVTVFGLASCSKHEAIRDSWWQVEKVNPIKLYEDNKVIAGFSLLNLLFKQGGCARVKSVMDRLLSFYNQGRIKPVVDSLWALEEMASDSTETSEAGEEEEDPEGDSDNKELCLRGIKAHRKCYLTIEEPKHYHEANEDCIAQGGTLATPRDVNENNELRDYAKRSAPGSRDFWIGVADIVKEGQYVDVNSMPISYWNWDRSKKQPTGTKRESCVVLSVAAQGKWYDEVCRSQKKYICEYLIP
ncbi:hypothetical protein NHX12_005370 [Muraenolepis orangiensis]|uniref:C-type lectin domain-containing protein n=1 Tax=Muraenolepis orangiensis TaxID=630683 RepID=A0A9Q0DRF9_9TELE|nr:hypothetical protein NHX12_005370 [Muraenolepis orangiensis]